MYLVSAGTTNLNVVGDNNDVNVLVARCSNVACTVLSRETFLANIHRPEDKNTTLERINIDSTASITSLLLYLNGGENSVHFDDTIAVTVSRLVFISRSISFVDSRISLFILHQDVFGGDDNDSFYFGQMYNDERNATYGVSTNDPIQTILTTKGVSSIDKSIALFI